MKYKEFKKSMKKSVFTIKDARIVAFNNSPQLIKLELHKWSKLKDIIKLKKGVYAFSDVSPNIKAAQNFHYPCYFSLEFVLNLYGIMTEAIFAYTLITNRTTKKYNTPWGQFIYQKIKNDAFCGFDPKTLIAYKEKALVDYFYLNISKLLPENSFWEESRLNAKDINFKKVYNFAKLFNSKKLITLLESFEKYAKTY